MLEKNKKGINKKTSKIYILLKEECGMELFWIFIYIAVVAAISLAVRWIVIRLAGRHGPKKRDVRNGPESKTGEEKKND